MKKLQLILLEWIIILIIDKEQELVDRRAANAMLRPLYCCLTQGDKIYNFGELLLHDILNCFKDSQYDWLYNLIHNLNSGNLKNFNKWLAIGFQKSPFLKTFEVFLKQKVIIMSLLELISMKSTTNKQLNFKEISEFTGTPVNDVEHLIIKCFSLNLIKGYINQIDEVLVVTWLQPRILELRSSQCVV